MTVGGTCVTTGLLLIILLVGAAFGGSQVQIVDLRGVPVAIQPSWTWLPVFLTLGVGIFAAFAIRYAWILGHSTPSARVPFWASSRPTTTWSTTVSWPRPLSPPSLCSPRVSAAFGPDGPVAGHSGCNSYAGTYGEDARSSLSIALLATTTDQSCPDPVMQQEQAYVTARQAATQYSITADRLTVATTKGPSRSTSYQQLRISLVLNSLVLNHRGARGLRIETVGEPAVMERRVPPAAGG